MSLESNKLNTVKLGSYHIRAEIDQTKDMSYVRLQVFASKIENKLTFSTLDIFC